MTNWGKNKTKVNLIIDVIMLILIMAIAGLGFLIKFVLVPGYKLKELYKDDVELFFLGLTRHQWGSVHLLLSFVFLALMIIHIILHWNMIRCIFRQMVNVRGSRIIIILFTVITALSLALVPLFVKPEAVPFHVKHYRLQHNDNYEEERYAPVTNDYGGTQYDTHHGARKKKNSEGRRHRHDEPDVHGY